MFQEILYEILKPQLTLCQKYFGGPISFQIDLGSRIYTQAFWHHLFHMVNNKYKQLFHMQYFNMGTAVVTNLGSVWSANFFILKAKNVSDSK